MNRREYVESIERDLEKARFEGSVESLKRIPYLERELARFTKTPESTIEKATA